MICIVFGLPGAGKTYIGKILENHFGFYLHDGDMDLPDDMRSTLQQHGKVTDEMRDRFFQNIIERISHLVKLHTHIVITQTFIKEKYREWIQEKFSDVKFLLVVTPDDIREKRLQARKDYPLDIVYSRQMVVNFDEPQVPYREINNSADGEEYVVGQLKKIFREDNQ